MFCLKCGTPTGSDSEFCSAHADDPVTDQTISDEEEIAGRIPPYRRCPTCNEQVLEDETICPACQSKLTPVTTE